MKVSHVNDHVTHAVIGGNKAIDFGISQSAEFFHILSSTLYTDQKLAVVRETLCNAWDAHIEAGITDKPVEVTITRDKFIIKDFGKGIPKDKIGPIYGTYGSSTKLANGNVTGGFGLGCKAPFAYVDHFEVISEYDGIKTIYNMSKSSAEVEGKPSIMPIISVPTEGTGIQVSIDVKEYDAQTFKTLVEIVTRNGGMKIKLNDYELRVFPFEKMKHGFFITSEALTHNQTNAKIFIRYGNVIYPIEDNAEYTGQYNKILEIIKNLSQNYYNNYRIVFQAEPDTISVTPSRESLSMQTRTIETISQLFKKFLSQHNEVVERYIINKNEESVQKTWQVHNPGDLLNYNPDSPQLSLAFRRSKQDNGSEPNLFTFQEIAERQAFVRYPSFSRFSEKDLNQRLNAIIESGYAPRGLVQSFRNEMNKLLAQNSGPHYKFALSSNWFVKRIALPLIQALKVAKLKDDKLFVYGAGKRRKWGEPEVAFTKVLELPNRPHIKFMPFLRQFVIIAHSRMAVENRARQSPAIKHYFGGQPQESLAYLVSHNPEMVEKAISFFKDRGYFIIDLTKINSWEDKKQVEYDLKPKEYAPKKVGIPCLSAAYNSTMTMVNSMNLWLEDAPRIEKPEFILKFGAKKEITPLCDDLSEGLLRQIILRYGSKGGIVVNSNQEARYYAEGAKEFYTYFWDLLLEELQTNPRIIASLPYLTSRHKTLADRYYENKLRKCFQIIQADKDLTDYFGMVDELNSDDKFIMEIWDQFQKAYRQPVMLRKKVSDYLETIPLDPVIDKIIAMIEGSDLIRALDTGEVLRIMQTPDDKNKPTIMKRKDIVRNMFVNMIEG